MTEFYLVKESDSVNNLTELSRSLSLKGRQERKKLNFLKELDFSKIYSSPAKSCQQTIKPIVKGAKQEVVLVEALRERVLSSAKIEKEVAGRAYLWSFPTKNFPGGESNTAAQQRVIEFLKSVNKEIPQGKVLISTHGDLLSLILNYYNTEIGFSFWRELAQLAVVKLTITKERVNYETIVNEKLT